MKFGKLQNIEQVDFELPTTPAITQKTLAKSEATDTNIYFGCTGWSMKEWVGKYYPKQSKSKDFLHHYARQFNTIELNTTHYRIPTESTIKKWYEATDDHFVFAPKIPQSISHRKDFALGSGRIAQFCHAIEQLNEKLGTTFMQLPPHFRPSHLPLLTQFLDKFPTKKIPLAIEVRHADWFKDQAAWQALLQLLQQHQVGTVITDVAGRRDVLHLALTTPMVMLRFVGNGLHPTDYQRIEAWIDRLAKWMEEGLEEIYFFSHQPDNILSPEMCIFFQETFEKKHPYTFTKKTKPITDSQMRLF